MDINQKIEKRFRELKEFAELLRDDGEFHAVKIFRINESSKIFLARGKGKDKSYEPGVYYWWKDGFIYGFTNAALQEWPIESGEELMRILGRNNWQEFLRRTSFCHQIREDDEECLAPTLPVI